jgi:hypothetical protein
MQYSENKNRLILTTIIVLLLLVSIIPGSRKFLFEGHIFGVADSTATGYVNDSLKRATSAFALARTFNAIISVARESELQLEPGGIGVSVAVGAVLDPANDLVERFSWVMLVSMTSLGVQKFLIEVAPFLSVQIILRIALISILAGLWLSKILPYNFTRMGKILLFVAILLRFSVPAMAYVNNQVYVAFLEQKQNQAVEAMGQTVESLETRQQSVLIQGPISTPQTSEEDQGWWKRTEQAVSSLKDQGREMLDVKTKLESLKKATSELIDHIVDLIVIFVISTIFLPILFLWGILKFGQLLINRGFGVIAEEWLTDKLDGKGNTPS